MRNNSYTFIIAEAGVNHNGDINIAHRLIEEAKNSGADAIKFQTFKADLLASKIAEKAAYQARLTDSSENQYNMLKRLELKETDYYDLIKHCNEIQIEFITSPFDLESLEFVNKLDIKRIKIPSGEINNIPYLRRVGELGKQIILSTGMSYLKEVQFAVDLLIERGCSREMISILHCHTEYPSEYSDLNLRAMLTMKKELNLEVGYSDHSLGIEIPIAAVAMGASTIEKHFTLNSQMQGPDHLASLEPKEFRKMVKAIRNVELALGDGIKKPTETERNNINIVRKSIFAKKDIMIGELFSEDNICLKRPVRGIDASEWDSVIGTKARQNYLKDDPINQ